MKSSYQELIELVTRNIESKDPLELINVLEKLMSLRETFRQDHDLLENVIRKVERELRSR